MTWLISKALMNSPSLLERGGGILGGHLLGWRTVCAVEWEPYPASVLCARQNDGLLPPFPIWDDVQTFDGNPWRGIVDVVSGGFPCQDISAQGKGVGIEGERSGMWSQMARIISEVRPQYAFIENSARLTIRGLERVLADLASLGFDAEWGVLSAADVGAKHERERIWILGHSNSVRLERHASCHQLFSQKSAIFEFNRRYGYWNDLPKPYYIRSSDGVAARVDRLKAIGNGQVPLCAATAFNALMERISE